MSRSEAGSSEGGRGRRPKGPNRAARLKADLEANMQVARPGLAEAFEDSMVPMSFITNHLDFSVKEGLTMYKYRVDFKPDIEMRNKRRAALFRHTDPWERRVKFDGTMMFSSIQTEELEFADRDPDGIETLIRVRPVGVMTLGSLMEEPMQFYNIFLRSTFKRLQLVQIGRNFFDSKNKTDCVISGRGGDQRMELWPGYLTAINMHDIGLTTTVDCITRTLSSKTVLDRINEIMRNSRNRESDMNRVRKELIGSTVLTRYNKNGVSYRIDGVEPSMSPLSKFTCKDREMSYVEYYQERWNLSIRDHNQPLLVSRSRLRGRAPDVLYLIPELCYTTGLTDEQRGNAGLMRQIADKTRLSPQERHDRITKLVTDIRENVDIQNDLADNGFTMSDKLRTVDGFKMETERVLVTPAKKPRKIDEVSMDFIKDIRNDLLVQPKKFTDWGMVYPHEAIEAAQTFYLEMKALGQPMGVMFDEPYTQPAESQEAQDYEDAIRKVVGQTTQFVLVLLPSSYAGLYQHVKNLFLQELGIPCQCVVVSPRTFNPLNKSIITKVVLQINAKCSGALWGIDIPLPSTMIIGIDLCHKTALKGQSVVGMVATIDEDFINYFSHCTFQATGSTLATGLHYFVVKALQAYYKRNKEYPEMIVVYRDGVSDGMLQAVVDSEVEQIKNAFRELPKYNPDFLFVITKRSINTRLFVKTPQGAIVNPPPGSCVEKDITHKGWWDFFLVSQKAMREKDKTTGREFDKGTVSPTHYVVVYSDTALTGHQVQMLTYKLTYLYFNWTGPIRVPAPVQYARKLSYLVGEKCRMTALPLETMATQLYYL